MSDQGWPWDPGSPVERLVAVLAAELDARAPEELSDGVTVVVSLSDVAGDMEQATALLRAAMSHTLRFPNGGCVLIGSWQISPEGVARIFIPPSAVVPLREVASRQAVARLFAYGDQLVRQPRRGSERASDGPEASPRPRNGPDG